MSDWEKKMEERRREREMRRQRINNFIDTETKKEENYLSQSSELKEKMNNLKVGITTLQGINKEKIIRIASNENLLNINTTNRNSQSETLTNSQTNLNILTNISTNSNTTQSNLNTPIKNTTNTNSIPEKKTNNTTPIKKTNSSVFKNTTINSSSNPPVKNVSSNTEVNQSVKVENTSSNSSQNEQNEQLEREKFRTQRQLRMERIRKERLEKERMEREIIEKERLEKERILKQKMDEEIIRKSGGIITITRKSNLVESDPLDSNDQEKDRKDQERLERERLERERLENERLENERLENERLENERIEKEELIRIEKEMKELERREKERFEKEEKERLEREEEERIIRERKERLEREEREREEQEREEEERWEKERKERRERERLEREREEREREEEERLENERWERERRERLEREEQDRIESEKRERERKERIERREKERLEREQQEKEKEEKEIRERERKEKEEKEKELQEQQQQQELERKEKEQRDKEEKEKLEKKRKENEKLFETLKIEKPNKVEKPKQEEQEPTKKSKGKKPKSQPKKMIRSHTTITPNEEISFEKDKKKPSLKPLKKSKKKLSTIDRAVPDVPKPSPNLLTLDQLFPNGTSKSPNCDLLKEHFRNEGKLEMNAAIELLKQVSPILKKEPNMLNLKSPVKIIGDIHGQYYDLLYLLSKAGDIKNNQFLFLGDYVDRGYFSCEVFLYLAALKITYKDNIFLLRGNHESRMCTKSYSFMTECFYKYDENLYNEFMLTFDNLPLAALLTNKSNDKFLCIHGGISAAIRDFISIEEIYRFGEIPEHGEMCDLVWADPIRPEEDMEESDMEEFRELRYEQNKSRGISYQFGYSALHEFLEINEINSIIRAHEVQKNGYEELWYGFKKGERNDVDNFIRKYPPLITVFSAPNYCDFYHNYGGFLQVGDEDMNFVQLKWTEHPYRLPNFLNAVSFSLPLIYENIEKLFLSLFQVDNKDSDFKEIVNAISKWDETVKQVREQRKAFLEQVQQFNNTPEEETFEKAQEFDKILESRHPSKRPVMRRTATSFW